MACAPGPPEEAKPIWAGVVWRGLGVIWGGMECKTSSGKHNSFENIGPFYIGKYTVLEKRKS